MFTEEERARLEACHWWRGVAGIWYAKRERSSPPQIWRDVDLDRLRIRVARGEPPPWRARLWI
jgi:hypothetical protein